jgi:hypothetical protein
MAIPPLSRTNVPREMRSPLFAPSSCSPIVRRLALAETSVPSKATAPKRGVPQSVLPAATLKWDHCGLAWKTDQTDQDRTRFSSEQKSQVFMRRTILSCQRALDHTQRSGRILFVRSVRFKELLFNKKRTCSVCMWCCLFQFNLPGLDNKV